MGVVRQQQLHPNPSLTYIFEADDYVAVMGNGEQLAAFQAFAKGVEAAVPIMSDPATN